MATKLYSVDIRIAATAYIKADSPADALRIARSMHGDCLNVADPNASEVPISAASFDDPALPDVSVAPVMTIYEPSPHVELAADNANREGDSSHVA